MEALQLFWFGTIGFFLAGYAILDGFDLGVGMLHLWVARDDQERRLCMNAIGPLWDGNEVWLVVFGGSLFAAFPEAYATAFSAFYLPFMFLLFCLIFRAVSLEFRSKIESVGWRKFWDVAFAVASGTAALLFGVAVGDAMLGMDLGPGFEYRGGFWALLHPYALLVGVFSIATLMMHGAIFLYLKTEGELQARLKRWMWGTFFGFLVMYAATTLTTLFVVPHATHNFEEYPIAWVVVLLNVLAVANIPRAISQERPLYAFISSSCTLAALIFLFGVALFPHLIVSHDPMWSLTIYNASSSEGTLGLMQIIAFIGAPMVFAYTGIIYWVFRGKVKLGKFSY